MALISDDVRQTLTSIFQKELQDPVRVSYFTQQQSPLTVPGQECQYCQETRELWETLAGLTDKLQLEVYDLLRDAQIAQAHGIDMIPASVLSGHAQGKVRYFGVPSGYEFATIIEDIVDLSKGTNRLSPRTKSALAAITQELHIQVFVTPT